MPAVVTTNDVAWIRLCNGSPNAMNEGKFPYGIRFVHDALAAQIAPWWMPIDCRP